MLEQSIKEQLDEIRQLFRETTEKQNRHIQELEDKLDKHIRETNERLDAPNQSTGRKMFKADEEAQEVFNKKTDKGFWEDDPPFITGSSKLVEALTKSPTRKLFQERGILDNTGIYGTAEGFMWEHDGTRLKVGPILKTDNEMVVFNVMETLLVEAIPWFLEDFNILVDCHRDYQGYRVYGGVAGIKIEAGADQLAYQHGLFVLKAMPDGTIKMLNEPQFKPRIFTKTD